MKIHSSGKNSKRLNVSWAIILGICTVLAAVIGVIELRYNISGVDASYKWDNSFAVNQSTSVIETKKHWESGKVYYGINQTQGTQGTKYSIYYKRNNGSYVLEFSNGYASYNNRYYGEWFMHSTIGIDKYTYKLVKQNNKNVKSKMLVDLFVV